MSKIKNAVVIGIVAVLFCCPMVVCAQDSSNSYLKARVVEIIEHGEHDFDGSRSPYQKVKIEIISQPEQGKLLEIDHGKITAISNEQLVKLNEKVIVNKLETVDGFDYLIVEKYRFTGVIWAFAIFFVLTVIFAGKRGVGAILGLSFSLMVLIFYVVPRILAGGNPILISVTGSFIIIIAAVYLAHGFNHKSSIALASIMITVLFCAGFAVLFVAITKLFGTGSEEAIYLQYVDMVNINVKGLLLGGIIIGTLGVLDDVAMAQVASIAELKKANSALNFKELFERGLNIGKEHISSMVNTLALAYVGASFPLLIFFASNQGPPLLVILNGEFIVEEIIRTLVGSASLVLAVPISTFFAAKYFSGAKFNNQPAMNTSGAKTLINKN